MSVRDFVCPFVILSLAPVSGWKNPRQSDTLNTPVFGTHDWIAFKVTCWLVGPRIHQKQPESALHRSGGSR